MNYDLVHIYTTIINCCRRSGTGLPVTSREPCLPFSCKTIWFSRAGSLAGKKEFWFEIKRVSFCAIMLLGWRVSSRFSLVRRLLKGDCLATCTLAAGWWGSEGGHKADHDLHGIRMEEWWLANPCKLWFPQTKLVVGDCLEAGSTRACFLSQCRSGSRRPQL